MSHDTLLDLSRWQWALTAAMRGVACHAAPPERDPSGRWASFPGAATSMWNCPAPFPIRRCSVRVNPARSVACTISEIARTRKP